jgi:hypothetical protein
MRSSRDVFAGLLYIVLGLSFIVVGRNYQLGTATAMGPGFFPLIVAIAVILCGLVTAGSAYFAREPGPSVSGFSLRPMVFVLAGVLAFAALVGSMGLIVSVVALVVFCRLAGGRGGILQLCVLAAVLAAVVSAIFVYGLGVPLQLGVGHGSLF